MTETRLRNLIEQHARTAILPAGHQDDYYRHTAEEANLLVNMRHILNKFAAALLSEPQALHEVVYLSHDFVVTEQSPTPHCSRCHVPEADPESKWIDGRCIVRESLSEPQAAQEPGLCPFCQHPKSAHDAVTVGTLEQRVRCPVEAPPVLPAPPEGNKS